VTAADVARLDSALCNIKYRDGVLSIAYRSTTVLRIPPNSFPTPHLIENGMIMWVLTKLVAVDEFFVANYVSAYKALFEAYLTARGTSLRKVTVYRGTSERFIEQVAKHCPNLVIYHAERTHGDRALVMLAQNCLKLEDVFLSGEYTDATIIALARNCYQLRNVRLEPRSPLSEVALTELIRNCPGLVSFKTQNIWGSAVTLTEAFLVSLADCCPYIEQLEVRGVGITEVGVTAFAARSPKLQQLRLEGGSIRITSTDSALATLPLLRALTKLDLLDVAVSDTDVLSFLSRCPQLHSLSLAGMTTITEVGMLEMAAQLPPLQSLYLGHCEGIITDQVLRAIAPRVASLRDLSLCSLSAVTDNGLCAMARSCPLLESIEAEEYDAELSDTFLYVLTGCCRNLQRVRFAYCGGIGSGGVMSLIGGCPRLTHITVEECDQVTQSVLRKVNRYPPYLGI
jgi:hypothetical protein